jgi:hypothetical protein
VHGVGLSSGEWSELSTCHSGESWNSKCTPYRGAETDALKSGFHSLYRDHSVVRWCKREDQARFVIAAGPYMRCRTSALRRVLLGSGCSGGRHGSVSLLTGIDVYGSEKANP